MINTLRRPILDNKYMANNKATILNPPSIIVAERPSGSESVLKITDEYRETMLTPVNC